MQKTKSLNSSGEGGETKFGGRRGNKVWGEGGKTKFGGRRGNKVWGEEGGGEGSLGSPLV